MKINLMCKNTPVCEFSIIDDTGRICSELTIQNQEWLPISVQYAKDSVGALQKWINNRSVSASREDLTAMLTYYRVSTPEALSFKNLGLNLSDQYWFKPDDSDLQWEEVNLFANDFVTQKFRSADLQGSSFSPDSSSNGELPKFWSIEKGQRVLYKTGREPFFQEPYNEVFASELLEKMNLPHVSYRLQNVEGQAYSICPTFVTKDTEYVSALEILNVRKRQNNENMYQHFLKCMHELQIPVLQNQIDTLLAFDYIIQNEDRHFGNFGFVRDINTLKFKGMAPIFDNGNSLWYRNINRNMKFKDRPSKPFRATQEEQLKLLQHMDLPTELLTDDFIVQTIQTVFSKNPLFDQTRIDTLTYNVQYTAHHIRDVQDKFRKVEGD